MPPRESAVETACTEAAASYGVLSFKLAGTGSNGKPDRLFFKRGAVVFVEFKRPGESLRPLQEHARRVLQAQGFPVFVVTSRDQFKREVLPCFDL